jgi:EpsI family protein
MVTRSLILVALIAGAGVYASGASRQEVEVPRTPLSQLPMTIADWQGRDAAPFDDDIVTALGVDDYINRHYIRQGHPSVAIYAGYYASQRQGDTIHSPQNCLPGAGWRPVSFERVTIDAGGTRIPVNRYLIQ